MPYGEAHLAGPRNPRRPGGPAAVRSSGAEKPNCGIALENPYDTSARRPRGPEELQR